MTQKNTDNTVEDGEDAPEVAAAGEPPAESGESTAAAEADAAPDAGDIPPSYEELEVRLAEAKDQMLRAVAEVENTRRRAEREKQDMSKYAIAAFARDVLSVADNLRRALDSVPEDARKSDEMVKNLVLGVEMTQKELASALEKSGVKPIEALDKPFDPNFHQAVLEIEAPEKPAGLVVQEMQKGYIIHDRLLRPAMVGVSKGGEKGAAQSAAEASAGTETAPAEKPAGASSAYDKSSEAAGSKLDEEL
jgi:molecular chaperone GrpE